MTVGAEDYTELLGVLSRMEALRGLMEAGVGVVPHSALAGDDAATDPWQTSDALWNLMRCGLDHMHALDTMVRGGQTLHLYAPFTLLRASLENAAMVVWLLAPKKRDERVRRRLVSISREVHDNDELRLLTEQLPLWPARLEQLVKLGARLGIQRDVIAGAAPGMGSVVKQAGQEVGLPGAALLCWRAWSGLTHGRLLAALSLLQPEEIARLTPGRPLMSMVASPNNVGTAALVAELMTNGAWALLSLRNQSPYPVGL